MKILPLLPRKKDTHKGHYGHVLVIGGSAGLTGAACLCALSALRSGAGLVTAGVPRSLNPIFETKLTEVMSLPLADTRSCLNFKAFAQICAILEKIDVLVIGPGASLHPDTRRLLVAITGRIDKPMVVDADGITALATCLRVLEKRKTRQLILTPHPGEFSRLIRKDIPTIKKNRKALVKEFALRYNLTLVLKGRHSLVSDGKKFYENNTGNPGMATAGTGDVLSGVIAGLLAQGLSPFDAARRGVYLHGLAGDIAARDKTENCLIASDVIDYLPKAFQQLIKSKRS